ncbi:hypothetical protein [Butyrivibrio sp. AE2032]|uniref:hypothetical protein n=1 Tax=Butyrivibrio sp. AE2032 TaxID=1458463 RepID=UPI00054D880C|nr:hypothetical protein [Butyrivibrio sp. AE2032]
MALFHDDIQKNKQREEQILKQEDMFQNKEKQDVMDEAFLDQNKAMNAEASLVMEENKTVDEGQVQLVHQKAESIQSSFGEMDKKKLKTVDEPNIVPNYKYVTLAKNCDIESGDSAKMAAVKNAINRYHELQGEEKQWNEVAVLEEVVKACNAYTSGKFSLFKFGKAAERLKEVKRVREDARAKIREIKKRDEEAGITPSQRFKKSYDQMIKKEDYYSAEIHSAHKRVADTRTGQDKGVLKVRIKNLQYHYPAMSYDEAEQLVIKLEFFKHHDLGNDIDLRVVDQYVSKEALNSAYKKREKYRARRAKENARKMNERFDRATKELYEKSIKERNPIARIFYRIFPWVLENQLLTEQLLALEKKHEATYDELFVDEKKMAQHGSNYDDDDKFM